MLDIDRKQNSPYGLMLLAGASAQHRRTQQVECARFAISMALALSALLLPIWPSLVGPLGVAGAGWLLISTGILTRVLAHERLLAATIQEQFDTWLFNMEWHADGPKPVEFEEVSRRARRFRGDPALLENWYPSSGTMSDEYAILLCQRANLVVDVRLRRRYRFLALCVGGLLLVGGLMVGLILDWTVRAWVVRWVIPSASALSYLGEVAHAQRVAAEEKVKLLEVLRTQFDVYPLPRSPRNRRELRLLARRIQDQLFAIRRATSRVPKLLYRFFEKGDRRDVETGAAVLRAQYG